MYLGKGHLRQREGRGGGSNAKRWEYKCLVHLENREWSTACGELQKMRQKMGYYQPHRVGEKTEAPRGYSMFEGPTAKESAALCWIRLFEYLALHSLPSDELSKRRAPSFILNAYHKEGSSWMFNTCLLNE